MDDALRVVVFSTFTSLSPIPALGVVDGMTSNVRCCATGMMVDALLACWLNAGA